MMATGLTISLAAGATDQELQRITIPKATEMEVVSPLVRSIFENRKKLIVDASQKELRKEQAGDAAQWQTKEGSGKIQDHYLEEYEKTLNKKVQDLDEEVAIFKKESKRLKNLAQDHGEGLTTLAREKAEWEDQKKIQLQAFQAQQEEQIEKLKKERQILDHRSASLNSLPAAQRKDVEELKENLAKQQEEHRGKELRLRLTIRRLRAMNEDLTRQVLEMQDEIRRYESCLLSAFDGRENGLDATPFSKMPCREVNHKHSCTPPKPPPPESMKGSRSSKASRQCSMEENCDALGSLSVDGEHCRGESIPKHMTEQAKVFSDLFPRPWMATDSNDKEDKRHQIDPKLADWR